MRVCLYLCARAFMACSVCNTLQHTATHDNILQHIAPWVYVLSSCILSRRPCVCAYMCLLTRVYIHVCTYMCVHTCVYIHLCTYMCVHTWVCIYMCVHTSEWIHVCVHTCVYIHLCIYTAVMTCCWGRENTWSSKMHVPAHRVLQILKLSAHTVIRREYILLFNACVSILRILSKHTVTHREYILLFNACIWILRVFSTHTAARRK